MALVTKAPQPEEGDIVLGFHVSFEKFSKEKRMRMPEKTQRRKYTLCSRNVKQFSISITKGDSGVMLENELGLIGRARHAKNCEFFSEY